LLAAFSGPLVGVALRHLGSKSDTRGTLISYHEKIFKFLSEEIKHHIDLKRVDLAVTVASNYDIVDLHTKAVQYVQQTDGDKKTLNYLDELKKGGSSDLLVRYLIEHCGVPWVEKNLSGNKPHVTEENQGRNQITPPSSSTGSRGNSDIATKSYT
jgi:hypothetical protein